MNSRKMRRRKLATRNRVETLRRRVRKKGIRRREVRMWKRKRRRRAVVTRAT